MGSEWKHDPIADHVSVSQGLAINKGSKHLLEATGLPLLRITDLINNSASQFINAEKVPKKCVAQPNELIFTRTGQVGLVFKNRVGVVHNNCFKVIPKDTVDVGFLYWFLFQDTVKDYVNSVASGSVQKDLNHAAFFTLDIPVPPLPEQKAIAHILGSLDDKIEANRRMNATLEGMAQALFRSWFVDFDPVIDNALAAGNPIPDELAPRAEVRKKTLANGTTQQGSLDHPTLSDPKSLFPAAFQFTEELGWIPEGWEVSSLEALATPKRGKTITKKTVNEGDIPVVAGGLQPAYFHNASNVIGPAITVSASGANAGYVNLYHEDIWASDCSYISSVDTEYFYSTLLFLKFKQDRITHMQQGAAQPHVYPKDLLRLTLAIPHEHLLEAFEKLVKPSFEKMSESDKEIQTLTKLRDTLLPKLISGELRLPEAEQLTEMAQA